MNISKGCIVRSCAGRDSGKLFYVKDCEGDYALLVDGKARKFADPKRKKLKHLEFIDIINDAVSAKLRSDLPPLDAELRRGLAVYAQVLCTQNKEDESLG